MNAEEWSKVAWAKPPKMSSLYVIEFDQGTIKVGYSASPAKRVAAHITQAAQFGIGVSNQWISDLHPFGYKLERTLVWWCASCATPVYGAEWFKGLDFEEVKATALELFADFDLVLAAS